MVEFVVRSRVEGLITNEAGLFFASVLASVQRQPSLSSGCEASSIATVNYCRRVR